MLYINNHILDLDLATSLPLLSNQRRERIERMGNVNLRKQSAAAYLLLCEALRTEYGITTPPTFGFKDGGKPYLLGYDNIHFNMSHCRTAAICVVDKCPVGVDIETIRRWNESLVRRTMNSSEVDQILASPNPSEEFISLWTKKEAILKLTGEGIRCDLREVLHGDEHITTVVDKENGYIYSIATQK